MSNFILSSKGLKGIPTSLLDNDFCFIIDSQKYYCNRVQAAFISPVVAQVLQSDPLCSSYTIFTNPKNNPKLENDQQTLNFDLFIKLMNGKPITIDQNNAEYLILIGKQLGNSELVEYITSQLPSIVPPLTTKNAIKRLLIRNSLNLDIEKEMTFIAQNFVEFYEQELIQLSPSILLSLLSDTPSLRIHSESWLLNVINMIISLGGDDYKCLYPCIKYENLTPDEFELFIEKISFEDIDEPLWRSLKSCFAIRYEETKRNEKDYNENHETDAKDNQSNNAKQKKPRKRETNISTTIKPSKSENMKGIFHYLSNVFDTKEVSTIVTVTSSPFNPQYPPQNVIDRADNDMVYFESNNEPNSWISFDFKDLKISLSHYALKTWFWPENFQHLRSWVVEGSDNGEDWTELDQRTNTNDLNDSLAFRRFKCSMNLYCRYIRIRSIDTDHSGSSLLILNAIEFYGRLIQ